MRHDPHCRGCECDCEFCGKEYCIENLKDYHISSQGHVYCTECWEDAQNDKREDEENE